MSTSSFSPSHPLTRRSMLQRAGGGFGCLALAALMAEKQTRAATSGTGALAPKLPHFPARAKRVIFLFMKGGPSHVDTFDPKPLLTRDDGKAYPFEQPRIQFTKTGKMLKS